MTVCYAVDALAFAVAGYAVWRLPPMPPEGGAHLPGVRSITEGVSLILRRPTLSGSFATDLFATLLAFPMALFPVVNQERFGGAPETLGLFLSALAAGGVGAGLLSGVVTHAPRLGMVQLAAAATFGAGVVGFGLAGPLWLALAFLALAGAADTASVTSRAALVQLDTPDSHRGRVSAVEHVVGVAGPELGGFRAGALAGLTSTPVALIGGGLAAVAGVAVVALTNRPLRDYRVGSAEEPSGSS